mmetsp:Transcript_31213/g.72782  ORF Transcript_31213/g.72782 Transcript_31213/m.72782 type:complete len:207 (-) Transcript_31213:1725-2345(-)
MESIICRWSRALPSLLADLGAPSAWPRVKEEVPASASPLTDLADRGERPTDCLEPERLALPGPAEAPAVPASASCAEPVAVTALPAVPGICRKLFLCFTWFCCFSTSSTRFSSSTRRCSIAEEEPICAKGSLLTPAGCCPAAEVAAVFWDPADELRSADRGRASFAAATGAARPLKLPRFAVLWPPDTLSAVEGTDAAGRSRLFDA